MSNVAAQGNKKRTSKQIELAQFFTPQSIATYMASLFDNATGKDVRILDPGAGEGILGIAVADRLKPQAASTAATFVELDAETVATLQENLDEKYSDDSIALQVDRADFLGYALGAYINIERYSHIIINPPYYKLRTESSDSMTLRRKGIVVTNIYAAFVWLSAKLLAPEGELVAIIPRSFCNGPYFLKFRQYILDNYSLEKVHIFDTRNKAFSNDGVLQENVIIHLKKQKQAKTIEIVSSSDHAFSDLQCMIVDTDAVIHPGDEQKVIHIPSSLESTDQSNLFEDTLEQTGISVSTGPVVDFRLKDYISESKPDSDAVPLIYPMHMRTGSVRWPLAKINKKGQYFRVDNDTKKWVVPLDGCHVIVRRFSSKEERRRIFASVVDPDELKTPYVAYENHVNFYHIKKSGLDKEVAFGLCAFLNSKIVDDYFRSFSGHTQVNVSDLKRLRYPSIKTLKRIGAEIQDVLNPNEQLINELVGRFA
jgi:adenine-specific DNA-methyltransferase